MTALEITIVLVALGALIAVGNRFFKKSEEGRRKEREALLQIIPYQSILQSTRIDSKTKDRALTEIEKMYKDSDYGESVLFAPDAKDLEALFHWRSTKSGAAFWAEIKEDLSL